MGQVSNTNPLLSSCIDWEEFFLSVLVFLSCHD
jgi:hypothetical protein